MDNNKPYLISDKNKDTIFYPRPFNQKEHTIKVVAVKQLVVSS